MRSGTWRRARLLQSTCHSTAARAVQPGVRAAGRDASYSQDESELAGVAGLGRPPNAPQLMGSMPRRLREIGLCAVAALAAGSVSVSIAAQAVGPSAWPAAAGAAARPLPFFYDLYTFRGTGDSTTVVAAFAVPAGQLEMESLRREVRYRFDVSLELADTTLRTVFRTDDSVYVSLSQPLTRRQLLSTHIEVQARPSRSTLQRVIMTDATTPGIGQLYTSYFPIPDYSGSELMLSDVALSQPGARSGWTRGGVTLALLPTSEFPGSAFDVYYEIYNLEAGSAYTTEIAVASLDDPDADPLDERSAVRVRYAGAAPARGGTVAELRHVDASAALGRFRITVTITEAATGRTAARSRDFRISASVPGVTLVPALRRGHTAPGRGAAELPGSH
jgi:hypothetical protein